MGKFDGITRNTQAFARRFGALRPLVRLQSAALVLMLAACSPSQVAPDQANQAAGNDAASDSATAVEQLPPEQQEARYKLCEADLLRWRDKGVIGNGGSRPGVNPEAWDQLTEAERTEIFEVAACIQAGGQSGEQVVTIDRQGRASSVESRQTPNRLHLP